MPAQCFSTRSRRWGEHRSSIILVGAQAIYLHTGSAEVALAEYTTDADLVLDPRHLASDPLIEDAMTSAGFIRDPSNENPGTWVSPEGIPVDLMVPARVAGRGRRGVTVGPHDRGAMRRAVGLEAVLIDHAPLTVSGLVEGDDRRIEVQVAGPAGLLVAKLHKVAERLDTPRRRDDKDAHDIYRLLVAIDTADLFAAGPAAPGSTMAGRAERAVGDPEQVSLAVSILAGDLLAQLD